MADILSLKSARKAKARAQKEKAAAENRIRHGLTRPERKKRDAEKARAARALDAHKREE